MAIVIRHLEGPLAGQEQRFDDSVEAIAFGRDPARCQVLYPPGYDMVCGKHFQLRRTQRGDYSIELCGVGCYVEIDGIAAENDARVRSGSIIRLGRPDGPCFIVEVAECSAQSEMAEIASSSEAADSLDDLAPPFDQPEDRLVDLLLKRKLQSSGFPVGVSAGPGERVVRFGRDPDDSAWEEWRDVKAYDRPWRDTAPNAMRTEGFNLRGALWWVAAALAAAAAAYLLYRREIVIGASLAKLLPAVTPPSPAPETTRTGLVDASVFGPTAVQAGEECLIQVFLHRLGQREIAKALASEADPDATPRGMQTLAAEIAHGQRVDVLLEGRGLGVDEERRTLVWRGEPCACQFVVTAPKDGAGRTFHPRVLVLVDSVPVGSITFTLKATKEETAGPKIELRGDRAKRYTYAFLSYASPDRAEVIKRAQGLKAGGTDFFNDLLSLEPGERWEKRLYQEIDRCDVFYLFWSSQAKDSEWVMKETEYALARRAESELGDPDIIPVIIEGPPPPRPPESLKDIHFNDSLLYVLAGIEGARPH